MIPVHVGVGQRCRAQKLDEKPPGKLSTTSTRITFQPGNEHTLIGSSVQNCQSSLKQILP